MNMKSIFTLCIALTYLAALTFSAPINSAMTNQPQNIVLPLNNWSSQRVLSKVLGKLIDSLDVPVEFLDISVENQWGALSKGVIHIQLEIWQPSMAPAYLKMRDQRHIIELGTHDAIVREEWWYPEYVEKLCPELPDWRALNTCWQLFTNSKSETKGIYYTGPWVYGDGDLIRALKLNYRIQRMPDDIALWALLKNSLLNKKPILLLNWTPNWIDTRIKGRFIEFPEHKVECDLNPEWGLNKMLVKDCGNPKKAWLKKAGWPKLQQVWPCVYELVKKVNFDNQMIAEAAAFVLYDGLTEEQAVVAWMDKYKNHVELWSDIKCHSS